LNPSIIRLAVQWPRGAVPGMAMSVAIAPPGVAVKA
jgi:hypothetical protein